MDTDIRCVLMCRIQLRLNGLDSFGEMAGRLGLGGARPCLDFKLSAYESRCWFGRFLNFQGQHHFNRVGLVGCQAPNLDHITSVELRRAAELDCNVIHTHQSVRVEDLDTEAAILCLENAASMQVPLEERSAQTNVIVGCPSNGDRMACPAGKGEFLGQRDSVDGHPGVNVGCDELHFPMPNSVIEPTLWGSHSPMEIVIRLLDG